MYFSESMLYYIFNSQNFNHIYLKTYILMFGYSCLFYVYSTHGVCYGPCFVRWFFINNSIVTDFLSTFKCFILKSLLKLLRVHVVPYKFDTSGLSICCCFSIKQVVLSSSYWTNLEDDVWITTQKWQQRFNLVCLEG